MKLLYGTGNQAKISSMKKMLRNLNIDIVGLKEYSAETGLEIPKVVESGNSPLENARLKAAAYYRAFKIPVFSCDSGLYFDNVPDDVQPGVHIRTINGYSMSDEEMTKYYSLLAEKYGDLVARYKNAICFVVDDNTMYESMDDSLSGEKFIITSIAHPKKVAGFPLDSLSIYIPTGKYYYDMDDYKVDSDAIENGFRSFFTEHNIAKL